MGKGSLVKPAAGGVDREQGAEPLGHSAATNRKDDDDVEVPPMVTVPLWLGRPDDP